jgi:glutamate-1-semialdehyde aminotransferase
MTSLTPGNAQTLSKMPENFPGNWPTSLWRGEGCVVYGDDKPGTTARWIDWTMGLAAVGIGYGNQRVADACWFALRDGPALSLPHRLEGEVAERLVDLIPCAEMVRFLKTGSEAAEAAIRVARAATGHDTILVCGYASWHSWYAATRPRHPGVPRAMESLAFSFEYNDVASFDRAVTRALLDDDRGGLAGVIMEPTLIAPPAPGFLEYVREITARLGAVLIFDEVVTGFRWSTGGYQKICGVTPDLATFAKAMGNGVPIAALVGRRDLMAEHGKLASGTYNGDLVGLAAARAVLDIYEQDDVCALIASAGRAFLAAFERANGIGRASSASVVGQPQHPKIVFADDADRRKMTLFLRVLCDCGVLLHPAGFNPSASHRVSAIDATETALAVALAAVAKSEREGTLLRDVPEPISGGWRPTQ